MSSSDTTPLAMVGALARVDLSDRESTIERLNCLEGVEPFEVGENERLGLVLEATSVEAVHELLQGPVAATPGVLGVWPISLEVENDPERVVQPGEE